ncbi:hypothetical protein B0T25DRAFT_54692 [Lasiosphaeria hispida]|uniref:Uncharacterized protein n=1 Tax=Lasiosphaeria hispida TaxID=260671 RepID=A0AAJ0MKI6_9PEZI|nr:hypothetical protein B0T25DRAFT_54692 [Lasiosphaeria hispida]
MSHHGAWLPLGEVWNAINGARKGLLDDSSPATKSEKDMDDTRLLQQRLHPARVRHGQRHRSDHRSVVPGQHTGAAGHEKSTFSDPPPTAEFPRSVIIGDATTSNSFFGVSNGIFALSGGVFSHHGRPRRLQNRDSQLNPPPARADPATGSSPCVTHGPTAVRRWCAVGGYALCEPPAGKVTDVYTKLGDSGLYSSWLVLVPEYGFDFSILSAPARIVAGSTSSRRWPTPSRTP